MEDVLTSGVFGMFQYVAPELGLLPFLAQAITIEGDRPLKSLTAASESGQVRVKYEFWPKWPQSEGKVNLPLSNVASL